MLRALVPARLPLLQLQWPRQLRLQWQRLSHAFWLSFLEYSLNDDVIVKDGSGQVGDSHNRMHSWERGPRGTNYFVVDEFGFDVHLYQAKSANDARISYDFYALRPVPNLPVRSLDDM